MDTIKDTKLVRVTNSKYPLVLEIEGEQYRFKVIPVEKEKNQNIDLSQWQYLFSYVELSYGDRKDLHIICRNINPKHPFLYIKHYRYDRDTENYIYEWFEPFEFTIDNNLQFIEGKIIGKTLVNHRFEITYYFKFQIGDKQKTYTVKRGLNTEILEVSN